MKSMCSPKWLKNLISAKEFRIIPAPIWRHVQSNADLSIESRFLWNVLWELCSMSQSFEKQLTWGFIGKRVGRSESTIRRWARALQKNGYLEIIERHAHDGTQLPSIFKIGIPDAVAKQIEKETPNRKSRQIKQTDSADVTDGRNLPSGRSENPAHKNADRCLLFGVDVSFSACLPDLAENRSVKPDVKRDEQGLAPEQSTVQSTPKLVQEDHSKPAPRGAVNATLSRLLAGLESAGKIDTATAVKERANQLIVEHLVESKRGIVLPVGPVTEPLKRTAQAAGEGAGISAQTLGGRFATQETKSSKENNNNSSSALKTPSQGLQSQVEKVLISRVNESQALIKRLAHEIAFSIEAGTFRDCSITKAINIAVKLVKEQRWTTPRLLKAA